jgi:hypothetical protein
MGFTSGDTAAGGLSPNQRMHILGQCTDLNILHWTLATINTPTTRVATHPTRAQPDAPWKNTYTFSQPLHSQSRRGSDSPRRGPEKQPRSHHGDGSAPTHTLGTEVQPGGLGIHRWL